MKHNTMLVNGLVLLGMVCFPALAAADGGYSESIRVADDTDDVVTYETDTGEESVVDLADFRDAISGDPDATTLLEHWDVTVECLPERDFIECITIPSSIITLPDTYEEHYHQCVDGVWMTTIRSVDSCPKTTLL